MTDSAVVSAGAEVCDTARPMRRAVAAESFRACYDAHYPEIAAYAFRLTGSTEQARDLVQEAFTRLFSRWVAVREPRPYLYHTITNLTRDARRAVVQEQRLLAALEPLAERSRSDVQPDAAVRDAVERLSSAHRDVVVLHYYGDLPVVEVARVLHRPEGTVKRLLSEARGRLARALGGSDE